jgi:hypothetical protein
MLTLDSVPVPVGSFCVREIDDETIFLGESGVEIHSINTVGTFIWKAIDGVRTLGGILDRLCDEYQVARETAERDLLRFVHALEQKGIVRLEGRGDERTQA